MGTQGHNDTVTYLYNQLTSPALGGYYNVTLQPWKGVIQLSGTGSLFANGANKSVTVAQFSPSANVTASIAVVNNLGCNVVRIPLLCGGMILTTFRRTSPLLWLEKSPSFPEGRVLSS